MSSLLWLCLSLLSFAVLSAHARPQPEGIQGNANNGQHHDSAKESDDIIRRVFKLSIRGRPAPLRTWSKHHQREQHSAHPCLESPLKCLRSTSQPIELPSLEYINKHPSIQPNYNPRDFKIICNLQKIFFNIHLYNKCTELLSKQSELYSSNVIHTIFPIILRTPGYLPNNYQQPSKPFQPKISSPSLFPRLRELSQKGVWKLKNELKIEGRISGATKSDLLDDSSNIVPSGEFSITSLSFRQNGFRNKRNTDNSIASVNTDTLSISRTQRNTESLSSVVDNVNTSPSAYAPMIFELLPVIREGYRNNAFNDVDKAVIRRIFGDMKIVMDEEIQTSTLNPANIPFGDQTTITGDVVDDMDYESTEDPTSSADNRYKRFKEDYNLLKSFADNIPNQLKRKFTLPSNKERKVRSSRSTPGPEAAAILSLLAENDSHVVLEPEDDEEDEEYDEYYEYEDDEEEEEEDNDDDVGGIHDYDNGSFAELIRLAAKHKQRKAKEGQ